MKDLIEKSKKTVVLKMSRLLPVILACYLCSCNSAPNITETDSSASIAAISYIKVGLVETTYDVSTNEISLGQLHVQNFAEVYQSPGGDLIYTAALEKGRMPDLYLVRGGLPPQRITNNDLAIEFSPVLNDGGDYAYAVSDLSMRVSRVVINGVSLPQTQDGRLYKHLEINGNYLVFACGDLRQNLHYLCVYNLADHTFQSIPFDGYIQKLRFLDRDKLLIQAYRLQTRSSDVMVYRFPEGSVEGISVSPKDEVLTQVTFDKDFTVDIIQGEGTALQLYNAYYEWAEYQLTNPFTNTSDARGRLSWNVSYRMEGMLEMVRLTDDPLVKRQLENSMRNLLDVRNEPGSSDNPSFLWASTAYSIDATTPISLMVDNAMIIYPMLRAVNMGVGGADIRDKVVATATKMYDHFDPWYNESEALYHSPKGNAYWADGVWLPYNQQNVFGLVLIELYKATGDPKYKQRTVSLAQRFKSEMITTEDNRLLWHYWPKEFYAGWGSEQMLSVNTPSREAAAIANADFEDISHAGLNVNFIVEFRKVFGDVVFTSDDVIMLQKTVRGFTRADGTFTVDISGDISKGIPSYRYIPHYGWSKLDSPVLFPFYQRIVAKVLPYFDAERLSSYLNNLPQRANDGNVSIQSITYDTFINSIKEMSHVYDASTVRTIFVKD